MRRSPGLASRLAGIGCASRSARRGSSKPVRCGPRSRWRGARAASCRRRSRCRRASSCSRDRRPRGSRSRFATRGGRSTPAASGCWAIGFDPSARGVLSLTLASAIRRVDYAAEAGDPMTAGTTPFELVQESSGGEHWNGQSTRTATAWCRGSCAATASDRARTTHGLRATPIVAARDRGPRVAVAIPHFWQNFPKAIRAAEHERHARTFSGPGAGAHELQGGEQKTHTLHVALRRRLDVATRRSPGSDARRRLRRPPEWCCRRRRDAVPRAREPRHRRRIPAAGRASAIEGDEAFVAQARADRRVRLAPLRRHLRRSREPAFQPRQARSRSSRTTTTSTTRSPASRSSSCAPATRAGGG